MKKSGSNETRQGGVALATRHCTGEMPVQSWHPRAIHTRFRLAARRRRRNAAGADAFTLLEVILSLAILAGAMAALGELGSQGFENARVTRDMAMAQLLCESKLAEITAGIIEPAAISGVYQNSDGTTFVSDGDVTWSYSIEVVTIDQDTGLLAVRVTVAQDLQPALIEPFSLVRWVPDPYFEFSDESAAEMSEE
jgi:type II secretion system protein I